MKNTLAGKTLLLTGASMGIGQALAIELAREGVNLVINARSAELLDHTRKQCLTSSATVVVQAGDASNYDTVRTMLVAARQIGNFFGFIHAAGLLHAGPLLWELSENDFDEVFQASVKAGFQLGRGVIPLLKQQGQGLAVFFGSGAAEKTQPGIGAYCAAKAAEEHLARQLAVEAPFITTFVYRPGIVETRMQAQAREARGGGATALHQTFRPWKEQGLLLSPREAAVGLVRLLQSDFRRFHGQTIDIRSQL